MKMPKAMEKPVRETRSLFRDIEATTSESWSWKMDKVCVAIGFFVWWFPLGLCRAYHAVAYVYGA